MSALRVRKFDPSSIKESRICFLIGKRHTGKSVLMKDLLYHMPRPDFVLAMAPTEDTLQMFREFLPEACIYDHFSQDKLERTVSLQRELVSRGKKRTVLILLDDCLYQKGVLKSTAMRHIFFNGRHDHISLMCAAQYMMDVDVSLRTNIDYLFCMRDNILVNRQKLYKYYFGQFPKYDDFDKVMTACTHEYRSLVLDGTIANTAVPTDCVMWYKASQTIPEFKLCKPLFWRWDRRFCLSKEAVREAQKRTFEIESVKADPSGAATVGAPGATTIRRSKAGISLVQTEDEHGNVVGTAV